MLFSDSGDLRFLFFTFDSDLEKTVNITIIGNRAFELYKRLLEVEFMPIYKLQIIREDAFTIALNENICIPCNVKTIFSRLFAESLKYSCFLFSNDDLEISSSVEIIGPSSFSSCCHNRKKKLLKDIKKIAKAAFSNCLYLKHADIPKNN